MRSSSDDWNRKLAPVDQLMFKLDSDARTRSTLMSVEVLETRPEWGRLKDDFERASRLVPRLRQRVVEPLFRLGPAHWVDDPDFDLGYHLTRIRVPEPGTRRQLLDLAQSLYARPLDLCRPLWEATLVEGLDFDGVEAALLFKLSHSVTDGVGGIEMDKQIRSYEPNPDRGPLPATPVPAEVRSSDLAWRYIRRLVVGTTSAALRNAAGVTRAVATTALHPLDGTRSVQKLAGSLQRIAGPAGVDPSPLLAPRGLNRRFSATSVALDDLRRAGKAHGYSLNDAYISALCGAMRIYHEELGLPIESLPLAMPVSLRTSEHPAGGNNWAAVRIAAPVGERDPVRRMDIIHELVITGRSEPAINALELLSPLLTRLPLELVISLAGAAASSDIQASNVPGHVQPTYIGGAKVKELLPFGPLPGAAMMAVLLSHAGTCYLGVHYDTDSFTDTELLDRCLADGFAEVIAATCAPVLNRADKYTVLDRKR